MNINLIGISGKIGAGKDTMATMIMEATLLRVAELLGIRAELLAEREAKLVDQMCVNGTIPWVSLQAESGWHVKKFAGKLKEVAALLTGVSPHNFESQEFKSLVMPQMWQNGHLKGEMTYRKFLQIMGSDAMRDHLHPNVWVNALFADYDPQGATSKRNWIITDVRFPNEAAAIKERGGILIRINRPGIPQSDHISETALDSYEFDYVYENEHGLAEMLEFAKTIVRI